MSGQQSGLSKVEKFSGDDNEETISSGPAWLLDDVKLLKNLVLDGFTTNQIAIELGIKPQRVQDKRMQLGIKSVVKSGGRERKYLVCRQHFVSDGSHNRLCEPCRGLAFWP